MPCPPPPPYLHLPDDFPRTPVRTQVTLLPPPQTPLCRCIIRRRLVNNDAPGLFLCARINLAMHTPVRPASAEITRAGRKLDSSRSGRDGYITAADGGCNGGGGKIVFRCCPARKLPPCFLVSAKRQQSLRVSCAIYSRWEFACLFLGRTVTDAPRRSALQELGSVLSCVRARPACLTPCCRSPGGVFELFWRVMGRSCFLLSCLGLSFSKGRWVCRARPVDGAQWTSLDNNRAQTPTHLLCVVAGGILSVGELCVSELPPFGKEPQ